MPAYWSAGRLKPGTAYADGAGCTLYKPRNNDDGGTSVFVATMHLPRENRQNACAGAGDKGIGGTGIHLGADAARLLNASTIRIVGIDADRTGIPASTLSGYGMTGYDTKATSGSGKIDYLFIRGTVQSSPIGHTVGSTKSNHLALGPSSPSELGRAPSHRHAL